LTFASALETQGSYAWFLWRRACSIGYAASFF
jgi:hypothetical protein